MDELYGNETNTYLDDSIEVSYNKEEQGMQDPNRKFFREFDYGIDTKDNVIIIEGEIQSGMTFDVVAKTRLLTKLNTDVKVFNILLNSPGGDVIETLALIDFMDSMKAQGITFNIIVRGAAMSAAALLLTCGTGKRMISKHSKIMVHQLSTMNFGKLEDIKSNAKFAEQLEDDCNNLMAEVTKKDKKFWKENQRSDYFLSAEEALELGIIDKIV